MQLVTILLLDTRNGMYGRVRYIIKDQYAEVQEFNWKENNNSCDCNRSSIMYQDDEDDLRIIDEHGGNVIKLLEFGYESFTGTWEGSYYHVELLKENPNG